MSYTHYPVSPYVPYAYDAKNVVIVIAGAWIVVVFVIRKSSWIKKTTMRVKHMYHAH